jgi:peptide/nickel transport system substrate-binding protein
VRRSGESDTVLHNIVESLVAYREDLSIAPLLADSIDTSRDGKTYTFKLRSGVTFQNGQPMTSADVKWSWDKMLDPATRWQCRNWYDGSRELKIEAVEAPDPQTVVFRLNAASPMFLHYMANIQCITAVLHRDSYGPDGTWIAPIGTGPFKLKEWKKGEYVLVERFDGYKPRAEPKNGFAGSRQTYLDRVRWLVIPDDAARKAALSAGQIDVVTVDVDDVQELRRNPRVDIKTSMGLSWNVLLMQTRDPVLSDVRIRKAIAHAIDVDTLVKVRTEWLGRPNPSAVPATSSYHDANHKAGIPFDLKAAQALLKEAGYNGQPIKIQANKKNTYMYDTAVVIQSMLKKAGFNVELEVLDWAAQLDNYNKGKYQLQSFRFSARTEPALNYESFTGSKDKDPSNVWDHPAAEALLKQAAAETDPAKRAAIFAQLHREMLATVPVVSLYNTVLVNATSKQVMGFQPWPMGKDRFWGVWLNR